MKAKTILIFIILISSIIQIIPINYVSSQTEGPNLFISDVTYHNNYSNNFYLHVKTELNITVINNGCSAAKDFRVTFKLDDMEINHIIIENLESAHQKNVIFSWTPRRSGSYTIYIIVDSNNSVQETYENDNEYSKKIKLNEPIVADCCSIPYGLICSTTMAIVILTLICLYLLDRYYRNKQHYSSRPKLEEKPSQIPPGQERA